MFIVLPPLFAIAFPFVPDSLWGVNLFEILPQNNLEELLVTGTVFIILLAIGVYLILNIRKSTKSDNKVSNDELLLRFSKLYDEGKLTREEYRQIKLQFAQKLKEERLLSQTGKESTDPRLSKKTRKKKKKRLSDSQEVKVRRNAAGLDTAMLSDSPNSSALLRSLLDGSEHSDQIDFQPDVARDSSAHTRSDSALASLPVEAPPRLDSESEKE